MIIDKEINSQIEQDYIFITGHLDVNQEYFVQKIEEGIKAESNLNNKTAIQGFMTDWNYFNNDPELQKLLLPVMDKLDKIKSVPKYKFFNSWGYAESFGHRTMMHCHGDSLVAGSLYLNDHDQELIFPKINEKVKIMNRKRGWRQDPSPKAPGPSKAPRPPPLFSFLICLIVVNES